jgi:two-component system chemotaxis response regulator CheB
MSPSKKTSKSAPIRVLVVDDSAVVRQMMTSMLTRDPLLRVTVAADPIIAMEKMKRARPDVILLDLTMPRMDGLTFLRKIMAEDPIPVVVCSALTLEGSDTALQALSEGAVEVVGKPRVGVADFLRDSADDFIQSIHCAAEAKVRRRMPLRKEEIPETPKASPLQVKARARRIASEKVIAIGASTGGTEALRLLLSTLPGDVPGILIVQHMPESFTGPLARHLDAISEVEVREAQDGDTIMQGTALIAPGDHHMLLKKTAGQYCVVLNKEERVCRHRPSVDVLFSSVAEAAGENAVGVILTGMGEDGAEGLWEMNTAGAFTIAQNAETSVVFGMPKQAISRGAVDDILPLQQISAAIVSAVDKKSRE